MTILSAVMIAVSDTTRQDSSERSSVGSPKQSSQKSIKIILHTQHHKLAKQQVDESRSSQLQQQTEDETRSENVKASKGEANNKTMITMMQPIAPTKNDCQKLAQVSSGGKQMSADEINSMSPAIAAQQQQQAIVTPAITSSLRSTSARIQQRQQRFLAAAAKSATSPSDIISSHHLLNQQQQQLSRLGRHNRQVANTRAANGQSMVASKMTTFEQSSAPAEPLSAVRQPRAASPTMMSPHSSVRAKSGCSDAGAGAKGSTEAEAAAVFVPANCLSAQISLIESSSSSNNNKTNDADKDQQPPRDHVTDCTAADSSSSSSSSKIVVVDQSPAPTAALAETQAAVAATAEAATSDKAAAATTTITTSNSSSRAGSVTLTSSKSAERENLTTSSSAVRSENHEDRLIEQQQQQQHKRSTFRPEGGFAISRQQLPSSSSSPSQQTNKKPNSLSTNNYQQHNNNYNTNNYHNHHHHHNQHHQQQYQHHNHHLQQQQQQQQHQHQQPINNNNNSINTNNYNINNYHSTSSGSSSSSGTNTMSHYKFHTDCQSSVLTYEQVKRLDYVMDQTVPIHGRGNFPTLYVKLKELIRLVKHKLQKEHSIEIRDVILNGGAASYVLAPENSHYNDLDLIFGTDLSSEDQFDVIRDVVIDCLKEFYPKEPLQQQYKSAKCCGASSEHMDQQQSMPQQQNESQSIGASGEVKTNKGGERENETRQTCDNNDNIEEAENGSDNSRLNNNNNTSSTDTKITKNTMAAGEQTSSNNKNTVNLHHHHHHHQHHHPNRTTSCELLNNSGSSSNGGSAVGSAKQQQPQQMPLNNCAIKEAYVHKMVKVNDDDRWSLISLGVQQSEANCGGQVIGSNNNTSGPVGHLIGLGHCASDNYFPALPSTTKKLEDRSCDPNNQTTGLGGSDVVDGCDAFVTNANVVDAQLMAAANHQYNYHNQNQNHHHHQQHNHHYQQQHRPKQFPNSIELKFVDRMRRKFEFSVDSFQIILDSLIQFYDYAPKHSIASQRDLMSSHLSSTVINTRPMIMSKRRCSADCCPASSDCMVLSHRMESNFDGYNKVRVQRGSFSGSANSHPKSSQCYNHHHNHSSTSSHNDFNTGSKGTNACAGSGDPLDGSRSYYQFQLDANSPLLTSEASSSGCSSSSSVVSSSSSSLSSCDEDHEDLYCDVDGQSSSSASTSSLLSSSVYSSDGGVVCSSSAPSATPSDQRPSSSECDEIINNNSKSSKTKHGSHKAKGNSATAIKSTNNKSAAASKATVVISTDPSSLATDEMVVCNGGDCCCVACCSDPTHSSYNDNNDGGDHEYDFESDDSTSCAVISENFYPTVIGRSEYGNFKEALYHLEKKLIATRSPEEIRGGGLLKYCNLLVKNYKPTNVYQIRMLERYMCSRFFIDFSDLNQQQAKLESYLANHFSDDLMLKIDYLTILHNVVQRSTVCLMNHELRLTLEMIGEMAFKLNEQLQQQQKQRQGQHLNQIHQQQQQQQQHHQHQHQRVAPPPSGHIQGNNPAQVEMAHQQQQFFSNQQHPKPLLIQSGAYRVKLVNYSLAKPAATTK